MINKTNEGGLNMIELPALRGSDCKHRESVDRFKKSKILITCQKNISGELSSKYCLNFLEFYAIVFADDKLLMNKFIKQNFGGGRTLRNFRS